MAKGAQITVTPSYDKTTLEAQIQTAQDDYNAAITDFDKESALKNYHYLNAHYHQHFLFRPYERTAPYDDLD